MNNYGPSYEFVVSVDVPKVIGEGNYVDTTINSLVVAELLPKAVDATKRPADMVSLHPKTQPTQKSRAVSDS